MFFCKILSVALTRNNTRKHFSTHGSGTSMILKVFLLLLNVVMETVSILFYFLNSIRLKKKEQHKASKENRKGGNLA